MSTLSRQRKANLFNFFEWWNTWYTKSWSIGHQHNKKCNQHQYNKTPTQHRHWHVQHSRDDCTRTTLHFDKVMDKNIIIIKHHNTDLVVETDIHITNNYFKALQSIECRKCAVVATFSHIDSQFWAAFIKWRLWFHYTVNKMPICSKHKIIIKNKK